MNLISSPGSGEATILAGTINWLGEKMQMGVIEGDIQTDIDAEEIRVAEAPVVQINTEGACRLSVPRISEALKRSPVDDLDVNLIEDEGNLA